MHTKHRQTMDIFEFFLFISYLSLLIHSISYIYAYIFNKNRFKQGILSSHEFAFSRFAPKPGGANPGYIAVIDGDKELNKYLIKGGSIHDMLNEILCAQLIIELNRKFNKRKIKKSSIAVPHINHESSSFQSDIMPHVYLVSSLFGIKIVSKMIEEFISFKKKDYDWLSSCKDTAVASKACIVVASYILNDTDANPGNIGMSRDGNNFMKIDWALTLGMQKRPVQDKRYEFTKKDKEDSRLMRLSAKYARHATNDLIINSIASGYVLFISNAPIGYKFLISHKKLVEAIHCAITNRNALICDIRNALFSYISKELKLNIEEVVNVSNIKEFYDALLEKAQKKDERKHIERIQSIHSLCNIMQQDITGDKLRALEWSEIDCRLKHEIDLCISIRMHKSIQDMKNLSFGHKLLYSTMLSLLCNTPIIALYSCNNISYGSTVISLFITTQIPTITFYKSYCIDLSCISDAPLNNNFCCAIIFSASVLAKPKNTIYMTLGNICITVLLSALKVLDSQNANQSHSEKGIGKLAQDLKIPSM